MRPGFLQALMKEPVLANDGTALTSNSNKIANLTKPFQNVLLSLPWVVLLLAPEKQSSLVRLRLKEDGLRIRHILKQYCACRLHIRESCGSGVVGEAQGVSSHKQAHGKHPAGAKCGHQAGPGRA